MKIGIFGDSFAEKTNPALWICSTLKENEHTNYLKEKIRKDTYIWHDYFAEQGHTVYDHGRGGSDIYYSYYQWLHNHEKYDCCIFLVTGFRRLSVRDKALDVKFEKEGWYSVVNIQDAVQKSNPRLSLFKGNKNLKNHNYNTFAKAAIHYYRKIDGIDPFRHILFCELMLKEIKQKRPDTIFVPAVYNDPIPSYSPTLTDLYFMETEAMGEVYKEQTIQKTSFIGEGNGFADIRVAHLSKKNHEILGKKIHDSIMNKESNFKISVEDYIMEFSQDEIDKCWISKKEYKNIIEKRYA